MNKNTNDYKNDYNYNENNIFAKILLGELPCKKIYEDEHVLAFHDIAPKASTHIIIIPRGRFKSFDDFCLLAGSKGIGLFFSRVQMVAQRVGLSENGYRVVTNHGENARQEVQHFHVHILGGETLGEL